MDLETEEAFKICGLCTQYVDESVVIKAELKSFLLEFLALDERKKNSPSLPEKTCLECYQSALECKRFRDACHKSISKLQKNNKIASDMILGKSGKVSSSGKKIAPSKKVSSEAMNSLKADAGASKKKKILESLGLDPDQIDIDVSTTPAGGGMTGRRSRSSAAKEISSKHTGTRGRQNSNNFVYKECHVYIKKVERDRADRAFGSSVMVDAPVSRPGKRKLTSQNTPASAPPSAKRPKGRPPKAANLTPNTVNAGRPRRGVTPAPSAPEDKEDTKLSRSSFGRVRNSATKSGYVYGKDLNISPDIEVTATPPPSKSKTPRKTVQGKQQESPIPFTSEVEEEDEDMEEVFPTIGPYQCEICQVITDTKAEFVAHIKGKHHDVVDEEVLNSLESDLRKSKKKQEKELSIANGTPAPQVKKTPAKKPKPASKKAKPKAKPASKKESWMCDICDQVLSKSTKTEILKHKASAACQAARKEREEKESKDTDDPLGNLDKEEDETPIVMENAEDDSSEPTTKTHSPFREEKVETKVISGDPFDAMLNSNLSGKRMTESSDSMNNGGGTTNGFFNLDGHNDHETKPVVVESVNDFANLAFGFP